MALMRPPSSTVGPIARQRGGWPRVRRVAALALTLALLGLAGCGGDGEGGESTAGGDSSAPAETSFTSTETTTATEATAEPEVAPEEDEQPSEEQQVDPGDEQLGGTVAIFTGRAGRITPRVVRVPPYLGVRVELRSGDGDTYGLRFGRKLLLVGVELSSVSARFDGLRPGVALRGTPYQGGNRVRVEATAEPGP